MGNIVQQTALLLGVLAAGFLGPALGIAALVLRRRRARARRRTPLSEDMLRPPGHTLRKQLDDASIDLQWDVFQLVTIPQQSCIWRRCSQLGFWHSSGSW